MGPYTWGDDGGLEALLLKQEDTKTLRGMFLFVIVLYFLLLGSFVFISLILI